MLEDHLRKLHLEEVATETRHEEEQQEGRLGQTAYIGEYIEHLQEVPFGIDRPIRPLQAQSRGWRVGSDQVIVEHPSSKTFTLVSLTKKDAVIFLEDIFIENIWILICGRVLNKKSFALYEVVHAIVLIIRIGLGVLGKQLNSSTSWGAGGGTGELQVEISFDSTHSSWTSYLEVAVEGETS